LNPLPYYLRILKTLHNMLKVWLGKIEWK
jgi:hypothetical protein